MSRIVEEQAQSANGSARDFFRKDHFYGLKVVIPENSIVEEFQKITMPIFEKIDVNISESQTLTKLRDWLLPMLMNGQVTVD
jgi:type I restriction enzyme S subunit